MKLALVAASVYCASALVLPTRAPGAHRRIGLAPRSQAQPLQMFSGPELAASQADLALAAVVAVEGALCSLNSRSDSFNIKPGVIGVGGAGLLVAAYVAMGEDFNTAALAAVGASVLLVVTYVLRLLEFQSDEPDRTVIAESGERISFPSPKGGPNGGWPKEYCAFALFGCVCGIATFVSAMRETSDVVETLF